MTTQKQIQHGGTTWNVSQEYTKNGETWYFLTRLDIMGRKCACKLPARYCYPVTKVTA